MVKGSEGLIRGLCSGVGTDPEGFRTTEAGNQHMIVSGGDSLEIKLVDMFAGRDIHILSQFNRPFPDHLVIGFVNHQIGREVGVFNLP